MSLITFIFCVTVSLFMNDTERKSLLSKIEGPYEVIELTRGMFCIVDRDHYDWLAQWKWRASPVVRGSGWYGARRGRVAGEPSTVLLHRQVMGAPHGVQVDHKNGLKFDCRTTNLRLATHTENNRNRPGNVNGTSKYKGVSATENGYKTHIKHNGKSYHLGVYQFPEVAATIYDMAALSLFHEFAYLNFPDEEDRSFTLQMVESVGGWDGLMKSMSAKPKHGYFGILPASSGRWSSFVSTPERRIHLGTFGSPLEAARERDIYLREHPESKAKRNFSDEELENVISESRTSQ